MMVNMNENIKGYKIHILVLSNSLSRWRSLPSVLCTSGIFSPGGVPHPGGDLCTGGILFHLQVVTYVQV